MSASQRLRLRSVPRRAWSLLGVVVLYLAVGQIFACETRTAGLLSPGGAPHYGVLALGAAYLLLRVVARFVVPGLAVFWGVRALAERVMDREAPDGR